jgi:hypothetical protein
MESTVTRFLHRSIALSTDVLMHSAHRPNTHAPKLANPSAIDTMICFDSALHPSRSFLCYTR